MFTGWNDIDRMFNAMDLFRSRMNRVFSEFDRPGRYGYGWNVAEDWPRTNLYDNNDHMEIRAEVPGLSRNDIAVTIQGNYLEISGTRKSDAPEGYSTTLAERGAASFTRNFTLPAEIETDKVEATLQNGILTLKLPKSEAAKARKITIG